MSNEVNILRYISENKNVTQRDIANHVGMSVGGVNLLLKKMVEAGWIRIHALKNPKFVQYILTPEGIHEKLSKTYHFVVRNYREILRTRQFIASVLSDVYKSKEQTIYLLGHRDELYELINLVVEEEFGGFGKAIEYAADLDDLISRMENHRGKRAIDSCGGTGVVVVWTPEYNQLIIDKSITVVNLLDKLEVDSE